MKLVVGLGNPGKEYENTRHNIGYELAMFAKKYDCSFRTERKFGGRIYFDINMVKKVIVAKPLTYMNLSGNAVKRLLIFIILIVKIF